MDAARARKLADSIARIVAEMLERRIKDPRLGFITVTDARLTGDLRDATVYYTVYGPPEEYAATAAALESAKGVIRSEVGRQTGLRHTPSLTFVADTVPDNARHIEELLERARAADAGVARSRAGALPAGDPDPYKQAADDDAADDDAADNAVNRDGAAGDAADGDGAADGAARADAAGNEGAARTASTVGAAGKAGAGAPRGRGDGAANGASGRYDLRQSPDASDREAGYSAT